LTLTGTSLRDRLTRRFSGPRVRMSVTVWAGTLILVTAAFRRTTSYGMVFVRPLDGGRSHLRTIVWVPRRRGKMRRAILDPLDAWIRRRSMDDAVRSSGVGYNPATLIDAGDRSRSTSPLLNASTNSPRRMPIAFVGSGSVTGFVAWPRATVAAARTTTTIKSVVERARMSRFRHLLAISRSFRRQFVLASQQK
jgi:hypothetical protein